MLIWTESFNEYQSSLSSLSTAKEEDSSSFFTIQESTIPNAGMGLFTKRFLSKNTYLFDYEGELLTEDEYFHRYPNGNGRYVAQINIGILLLLKPPIYIDGIDPSKSNLARYINSFSRNNKNNNNNNKDEQTNPSPNVYWKKQRFGKQAGSMHFYTLCDIEKGEELFFDYGNDYWEVVSSNNNSS